MESTAEEPQREPKRRLVAPVDPTISIDSCSELSASVSPGSTSGGQRNTACSSRLVNRQLGNARTLIWQRNSIVQPRIIQSPQGAGSRPQRIEARLTPSLRRCPLCPQKRTNR